MQTKEEFNKVMKGLCFRLYELLAGRTTEEEFKKGIKEAYPNAIQGEVTIYGGWANNTVVGTDLDIVWKGKLFPIRMITQNPNKRDKKDGRRLSKYAAQVREGAKIVWVMKRTGTGIRAACEYTGRISDGVYIKNGQTYEPATPKISESLRDYVLELQHRLPAINGADIEKMVIAAGAAGILK